MAGAWPGTEVWSESPFSGHSGERFTMTAHPIAETVTPPSLSVEEQLDRLRRMHEIRCFEEEVQQLFTRGSVRGSTHLCQGQEAVAVGACCALRKGDTMLCTYRGHGAVLAMGAPLDRAFGEIMGKADGLNGGKGGSMHLTDVSVGALGSFAIIGAHLPIAVGVAFAARYRESKSVCLCIFGDGAVNIGAFHEALNLAALWKLPVIFLCENNLYGEYSPVASTTSVGSLVDRAAAYAMAGEQVDGNDLQLVHAAMGRAIERAEKGEGATLLEALTYRHKGHSRSDPATYRPDGELERWLEHDPIKLTEARLVELGVSEQTLDDFRSAASSRVAEALARADGWPEPDAGARFSGVWA
jgi:TPP-dependent pyruvate/acetoin dehydrogenase alpha subunit